MNCRLLICLAWLVLAFTLSLPAATYEVAQGNPQASDDGDGSHDRPWKTISKAAGKVEPGDIVLICDGVYRERVLVQISGTPQAPIRFEAAPGAHVVITGADHLSGWKKVEGESPIYRVPWTHRFIADSKNMTHPDDDYHQLIGRCEQVVIDGYLLRQVLEANQLAPGAFFVDIPNQSLAVWDSANRDVNKLFVQASVRQEIFQVKGDYVELRGLGFRFAANMAQRAAVVLMGAHDTLEDCTMEGMNSSGAAFLGEHQVVRRCVFRDNGQLGFAAARAHDLLFTECLVENNNTKGFNRSWEAGGNKLVRCRGAVLERSRFLHNRGSGIWFDIGNEQCVVRQCLIADNEDCGIFYEISFGLQAHDNVIVGNGFVAATYSWSAPAGISLSSSPGCLIERNLIVGNWEGFNFFEHPRTTSRIDTTAEQPIWNHDETISRNIIAFNWKAQVGGRFDMKDGRQWPAGATEHQAAQGGHLPKPGEIAGSSAPKNPDGQPEGLTLEKLRLSFVENVYFSGTGQGWFEWGVPWSRHKSYSKLTDFQADLGIDKGSRVLEPSFANLRALDCRLSPEAMATVRQCYPQGPVPGVILGIEQ